MKTGGTMPGRVVINSHGLGVTVAAPTSADWISICSESMFEYAIHPPCWSESYSTWAQAAVQQLSYPVAAPGSPATALTDPNAVLADTSGSISQDLSNQAILQTQANAQAAVNDVPAGTPIDQCALYTANWPWPIGGLTCPEMVIYGAVAAAVVFLLVKGIK
jgi:hypothetical protein